MGGQNWRNGPPVMRMMRAPVASIISITGVPFLVFPLLTVWVVKFGFWVLLMRGLAFPFEFCLLWGVNLAIWVLLMGGLTRHLGFA